MAGGADGGRAREPRAGQVTDWYLAVVGVIGGGQLGRMLALAGIPLGLSFRFLDPSPDAPAGEVGELLVGEYDDPELLDRLADGVDAVTYEFENVPRFRALRRSRRRRTVWSRSSSSVGSEFRPRRSTTR